MILTYDILKSSLTDYKAPDIKIKRMSDNKEIIKLTKNLYVTDKNLPGYLVANAIYNPSYLSFDYALSYHGLIPEIVYTYTSATFNKKKKKQYKNDLGTFTYRDVPFSVYPYGIQIMKEKEYSFAIASAEKALCDKLYSIRPVKNQKELKYLLFDDLRIDEEPFYQLNFNDIQFLCDLYHSTNLKLLKKVIGEKNGNNYPTND